MAATGIPGQGNVLMLGIDMTGDRSLREYDIESGDAAVIDDPLVFLAQPDSLMVTADFAARNGLAPGARVPLETAAGRKDFVVRGVLKSGGLSSAFGGNIAVMDIYAAQHVFGRGRRFDRIDIALTPGVALQDGQEALRTRARARLPGADACVERTELSVAAAHLSAHAAILERRGARHRDVHHLQLVRRLP